MDYTKDVYTTFLNRIKQKTLGLSPTGSNNAFSYWYSSVIQLPITTKNPTIYRSIWTIGSTATDPNKTVQFRLRINQQGAWSAWDRVVNSYLSIAPSNNNPREYPVFFDPVVSGTSNDKNFVFSFDILSFDITDDLHSWIFIDELLVDKVTCTNGTIIANYDFSSSSEGWLFAGKISNYDPPASIIAPGRIGLNPQGSANCFSYWSSPDIEVQNGKLYRLHWEIESSVLNPDDAVQFRLRANQRGTWSGWNRIVNSYLQNAPAWGYPKFYDVFINPSVSGIADDNQIILSFDILSFDSSDDLFSWDLLNAVSIEEVFLNP
ncbi:MAG: hypothetical protein N2246_06145 [Candidatus Sumerlaeia bacterium]|nr:hypothetical protein [Candidatus Sumerlaeia bacterium]